MKLPRDLAGTDVARLCLKFKANGSNQLLEHYRHRVVGDVLMSELHRITINSKRCGGRPCLRGLRVRVSDILDLLAAGATHEEILEDYPYLQSGDITAALQYAARQLDHTVLPVQ